MVETNFKLRPGFQFHQGNGNGFIAKNELMKWLPRNSNDTIKEDNTSIKRDKQFLIMTFADKANWKKRP